MQAATRRQRSTISPASQRHTRTSKPYLCVGVMEREKWSLRDGEESIRGGKIPPPLEPAPPLTPIGTPATPNLPRAGGPGPSRPGPMAARGGPPDPTAEEKLPHPIIQSAPRLQKTIRHPGKAHLPRLYWTPPPCGGTDASKTPTPEPGPSACTNPCSSFKLSKKCITVYTKILSSMTVFNVHNNKCFWVPNEWILKDHMTLKTGVIASENSALPSHELLYLKIY